MMDDSEKIDNIYKIVSRLDKSLGVLESNHKHIEFRVNQQQGQLTAVETVVEAYKIEKAKLGVGLGYVGKAASFLIALGGTIFGGVIVGVITFYILKH